MLKLPANIEMELLELMSGGVFGDGIGPGNTAATLNNKYSLRLDPQEVWALWQSYLPPECYGGECHTCNGEGGGIAESGNWLTCGECHGTGKSANHK